MVAPALPRLGTAAARRYTRDDGRRGKRARPARPGGTGGREHHTIWPTMVGKGERNSAEQEGGLRSKTGGRRPGETNSYADEQATVDLISYTVWRAWITNIN